MLLKRITSKNRTLDFFNEVDMAFSDIRNIAPEEDPEAGDLQGGDLETQISA